MRQGQAIEIDIEQLAARRARGVVVDVREPVEFVAGHVPRAMLMPMGQLPARMAELDRQAPVS